MIANDSNLRQPLMVMAGAFWSGGSEAGLAHGFRREGWAVQDVDSVKFAGRPGFDLVSRALARLTRPRSLELYREAVKEACQRLRPDVFMTVKGAGLTPELLDEVNRHVGTSVMYYPDFHFAQANLAQETFSRYGLFVTTKSFQVDHLAGLLGQDRVAYVPHGHVDQVHRPLYETVPEQNHAFDVMYVGIQNAYKQRWMNAVCEALPDRKVGVAGQKWQRAAFPASCKGLEILGPVFGVEYVRAIQLSRINVALHQGPTESGWEDFVSTRTFEIPACKGFMLHIDNEETREFFEPGREIDVFSSPEELGDKIRFYLARPELRAEMIERAYARCHDRYGYASRAKSIAQLVAQRRRPSA